MEFSKAQEKINNYFKESGFKIWPRFAILARLEEEISEIGRIISVEEGLREKWKVDNLNYEDEFGDAIFQLLHLANQCGVSSEKAINHALNKYEKYKK